MSVAGSLSLRARALRAGGWSLAGFGLGQVLRLATNLVMTRLLMPEMFGIMAIAGMVSMVLALLADIGLQQNIVRHPRGDDPAFLDTVWVTQIVRGFGLWTLALGVSAGLYFANGAGWLPAGSVYASPVLPLVLAASSFSSVLGGLQSTKMATAQRRFDQKRLSEIALISQIVALGFMVVIGTATHSIWALVAGGLVYTATTTVLSHAWMNGHPNRLRFERAAVAELIGFGKWIFVSSAIGVLAAQGDRLLLGAFFSAAAMGLYAIALLFVGSLEGVVQRIFIAVSLPAFSEIARTEPRRLREVHYKVRMPADVLLLFVAGLLFAAGTHLIDLLYDRRYAGAGPMLQILALSLVSLRYSITQQLYLALGHPGYLAAVNVLRFVALYALVPLAYYAGGERAVLWAVALHALATAPLIYALNARLGLNDLKRELLVLPALPAGYLLGAAFGLLRG